MIILKILAFCWFCNLFCWRFDWHVWIEFKEKYLKLKIFYCSTCFSFWLSIILLPFFYGIEGIIILSLVNSLISSIIEKYLSFFS